MLVDELEDQAIELLVTEITATYPPPAVDQDAAPRNRLVPRRQGPADADRGCLSGCRQRIDQLPPANGQEKGSIDFASGHGMHGIAEAPKACLHCASRVRQPAARSDVDTGCLSGRHV